MKNTLAFYFKYFGSEELPALFAALKRVFDAENVSFYLIGARARDVWFLPQKQTRITFDIDWIVASSEKNVFENIKRRLIAQEGFNSTQNPFTLLSSKGTTVDLLPFLETDTQDLAGLKEVFQRGTENICFDDSSMYQVATLPAIVLLKLIAWNDRPEHRIKDLSDIAIIFEHYFDLCADDIYDNHNDLFEQIELDAIAAQVIGRKIKYIIGDSNDLNHQIIDILTTKQATIAKWMITGTNKIEKNAFLLLQNLLNGILGK
jgi:predicted nucleotidyltransferase